MGSVKSNKPRASVSKGLKDIIAIDMWLKQILVSFLSFAVRMDIVWKERQFVFVTTVLNHKIAILSHHCICTDAQPKIEPSATTLEFAQKIELANAARVTPATHVNIDPVKAVASTVTAK
jgi:hypothetical protein